MKIKLTKDDVQEVMHKMGILADEPGICEEYGITEEQAVSLYHSIPNGGEWEIPQWALDAVREEMMDHVRILDGISQDARSAGDVGQSLRISKQARRFEKMFE